MESTCAICGSIPDYLAMDTLNTSERLPEAVKALNSITRKILKCPKCGIYFENIYEHDSELAMGENGGAPFGYTDESIERLTRANQLERMQAALEEIALYLKNFSVRSDAWAVDTTKRLEEEKFNLENELKQIDARP